MTNNLDDYFKLNSALKYANNVIDNYDIKFNDNTYNDKEVRVLIANEIGSVFGYVQGLTIYGNKIVIDVNYYD